MKFQIDPDKKIISIEETVNLGELMGHIQSLLPNGEWKEYRFEVLNFRIFENPIGVDRFPNIKPYTTPFHKPNITC